MHQIYYLLLEVLNKVENNLFVKTTTNHRFYVLLQLVAITGELNIALMGSIFKVCLSEMSCLFILYDQFLNYLLMSHARPHKRESFF